MSPNLPSQKSEPEESLGFDPISFVLGLWLHKGKFILAGLISVLIGISCAILFGKRLFIAETVLQYKAVGPAPAISETTFILTQMSLVKLKENLSRTREKLNLPVNLQTLGSAIKVNVERNTTLLKINATWDAAETASMIANTIRDEFLQTGLRIRQRESQKTVSDLKARLKIIEKSLSESEKRLQEFTTTNKVVDLDKEAQWYLEQLIDLDLKYEEAQVERKTVELQVSNLSEIIKSLNERVSKEQNQSSSMDNLGDINIKVIRLRDAIHQDKQNRAGKAELLQSKQEYERMKSLFAKRLVAQADVDKAKNAYLRQKALSVDTPEIENWKNEIDNLNKLVIPDKDNKGPTGPILQAMMLKSFELDLEKVGVADKEKHYEQARNKVKDKLDRLPLLQREFIILSREVASFETEKKIIEENLTRAAIQAESNEFDFATISMATTPILPFKSNRRIIALGGCLSIFTLLSSFLILFEFLDSSIRSGKDFEAKLKIPLLGVLPTSSARDKIFPGNEASVFIEQFRIIAHNLRLKEPDKGAIFLITSPGSCQGKTMVTSNLAACFGRTDEKVLMMDAQVRETDSTTSISSFLSDSEEPGSGIGEYLSFNANHFSEIVYPSILAGVSCIPRVQSAVIPDLLSSKRMQELLNLLREEYSIILIDAPPVLKYVDSDVLSEHSNGVILVVRSRVDQLKDLTQTIKRIEESGGAILGAILTDVNPIFLSMKI